MIFDVLMFDIPPIDHKRLETAFVGDRECCCVFRNNKRLNFLI